MRVRQRSRRAVVGDIGLPAVAALCTILSQGGCTPPRGAAVPAPAGESARIVRDTIPATLVTYELVYVPGGTVVLETPAGRRTEAVAPFYIGRTEVPWEMYDVYMLRLDEASGDTASDAIARPSRPYGVPDYEWGHDGYATISVAHGAAESFAQWLSSRTGHRYRLPTEAEWQLVATLAAGAEPLTRERLDAIAWHRGNANRRTHPVGSLEADALGLYDLYGNAAEWVRTADGGYVTRGGSFRDDAAQVGPHGRAEQTPSWTARDPQIPPSVWWLSDAPFVGFRLVREAQPPR